MIICKWNTLYIKPQYACYLPIILNQPASWLKSFLAAMAAREEIDIF